MNWSGTHKLARVSQLVTPSSELEICSILRACKNKIRPIGSGLTFENVVKVLDLGEEAVLMSLEKMTGLISWD